MQNLDAVATHEIFDMKHTCVQEDLPPCEDVCPLHINIRALMRLVSEGNFDSAYAEYRKRALFPEILSRACSFDCSKRCVRSAVDESVDTHGVELAICMFAQKKQLRRSYIRPQGKKVAIVGGGITGLSASIMLAQKGYEIHVYESSHSLGGSACGIDSARLPAEIREAELHDMMSWAGVRTHCDDTILDLSGIDADSILLASKAANLTDKIPDVQTGSLGGGLFIAAPQKTTAEKIAEGKRLAKYIERYLKDMPLTGGDETQKASRLQPNVVDAAMQKRGAHPTLSPNAASAEAQRCLQCECKVCVKSCLLMQEGLQYPKKYIVDAQQSLRTVKRLQNKLAARRTNACNLCGLCGEICPQGIDMGEVYLQSRRIMHSLDELPEAFHTFWLTDMAFHEETIALCRTQPGYETAEYMFFPGCQLGGSNPAYVIKTYEHLCEKLEGGVALDLHCCGAPSEWSGYDERTQPLLERFKQDWEALGKPKVILACPTCNKMFRKYHPDVPVISLWEILSEYGVGQTKPCGKQKKLAIFDPCSSRYQPGAQAAVRFLLQQIGVEVEELPNHGRLAQCCSYGGLISASNPKLADKIVQNRSIQSETPYVTYCANCKETLRKGGKQIWHLLDLLFNLDNEDLAWESISDRRKNRREMRNILDMEVWNYPVEKTLDGIAITITDSLRGKMERELVLKEDLATVIDHANKTGRWIETAGKRIAHLQIGCITYWVEYRPYGEGYEIINAYTHRIQIEEDV